MPLLWEIPEETKRLWDSMRESMRRPVESIDKATKWPFSDTVAGPGLLSAFDTMYPQDVKEGFIGGILGLAPGYIASNFRSPEQIQALRRMMSEEMRSRGPMGQVQKQSPATKLDPDVFNYKEFMDTIEKNPEVVEMVPSAFGDPIDLFRRTRQRQSVPTAGDISTVTDPIDQILRGSWYHGMRQPAREKVAPDLIDAARHYKATGNIIDPKEVDLFGPYSRGFPISLHNDQSISNKLGEPAGVSISMLPTKAKDFSADEYIHRVLPQYGGPPTQRVVNLMSPEGRTALNDAYDVVANKYLNQPFPGYEYSTPIKEIAGLLEGPYISTPGYTEKALEGLHNRLGGAVGTGPFNQQLSNQLQSQGYRGLLYNPQRWNEHEMLMLDPKYVLPLDYRPVGEYIPGYGTQVGAKGYKNFYDIDYGATPGIRRGLDQIQDLMSQNKSRLGDIYSERPWIQRLSNENKQRLLELIDPQYREIVGNQLYQP